MKLSNTYLMSVLMLFLFSQTIAQNFYFGADLSYVNEMDDCGAVYKENDVIKDAYQIFANHNTNLVRLRLWHTPSWYEGLNDGNKYSDFNDIKRSISRAKETNMKVLLDFHLSDSWADPSKQLVPAAWLSVVDNTDLLKDSLYNYVYNTLDKLAQSNLLPEMVQIGNETNRGILLSPSDNQQWTLDWNRNAELFNIAIKAVRDIELITEKEIEVLVHLAGPAEVEWYVDEFVNNGITDFDAIGISYYWSWHKPTTISDAGDVISRLKNKYPSKQVIIVETGYIWTLAGNDSANNIIDNTNPDYGPASPESQRDWLIDLSQEVINSGGSGVIYWEPAWITSTCNTLWGQGSHQENATFFDYNGNLMVPGGIQWSEYPYTGLTSTKETLEEKFDLVVSNDSIVIRTTDSSVGKAMVTINDSAGKLVTKLQFDNDKTIDISKFSAGSYFISITKQEKLLHSISFIKL